VKFGILTDIYASGRFHGWTMKVTRLISYRCSFTATNIGAFNHAQESLISEKMQEPLLARISIWLTPETRMNKGYQPCWVNTA